MLKHLVIDLNECIACDSCGVRCEYFYAPSRKDHGVFALRERATYAVICRRCEEPSCVDACPFNALEKNAEGILERHNLRCVSCKLCAQACPFGTIYPDMLSFYVTPCDHCMSERTTAPPCVSSCGREAIKYRTVDPEQPGLHIVDERLAAVGPRWIKREAES